MAEPKKKSDNANENESGVTPQGVACSCIQDPYAELPPEMRPRQKSWKDALRKVICPGCGFKYWTNRETDLCPDCEKKGVKVPLTQTKIGEDQT